MSVERYNNKLDRLSRKSGKLYEDYFSQIFAFSCYKRIDPKYENDFVIKIDMISQELLDTKKKLVKLSRDLSRLRDEIYEKELPLESILDMKRLADMIGEQCNKSIVLFSDLHLKLNTDRNFVITNRVLFEGIIPTQYFQYYKPRDYNYRHLCNCNQTNYEIEPTRLDTCSICYEDNVLGIMPECCRKCQKICLQCLHLSMSKQYKSIFNQEIEVQDYDTLFKIHYQCDFCRQTFCYKKYRFLFQ
jgi:uncharacterized protein YlaN (UPF0358 family)